MVLFNEAVVMEDRGQAMNAVETWNRYLRFERDPRWLADGRHRLEAGDVLAAQPAELVELVHPHVDGDPAAVAAELVARQLVVPLVAAQLEDLPQLARRRP